MYNLRRHIKFNSSALIFKSWEGGGTRERNLDEEKFLLHRDNTYKSVTFRFLLGYLPKLFTTYAQMISA